MAVRGGAGRSVTAGGLSGLTTQQMLESGNAFNGAGGLAATGRGPQYATVSFNGASSLVAQPQGWLDNSEFDGVGALAATSRLAIAALPTFNGAGSLTASTTQQMQEFGNVF